MSHRRTSRFTLALATLLTFTVPILWSCRPTGSTTASFQDGAYAEPVTAAPVGFGISAIPSGCPLPPAGIIEAASVPVGGANDLRVVLQNPAPPGGVNIRLQMADSSIATAGASSSGLFAELHIPEGQQVSPFFDIFGKKVGQTFLTGTATGNIIVVSLPVGVWDVGDGGQMRLFDMNPRANHCRDAANPDTLSTDPTVLATCGRRVRGGSADGVTPMLVRVTSGLAGTSCVGLPGSSPDPGQINPAVAPTVSVGGQQKSFNVYTTPGEMETTDVFRTVDMDVTFVPNGQIVSPSTLTVPVTIVPPPLVAVHGLWSNDQGWHRFYGQRNNRFRTAYLGNYGASNNQSFANNVGKIPIFAEKARVLSRMKDYAATQVDVVAHSMGGILTRLHLNNPAANLRPNNFNQGDVNKFVILDSPQHGSNLANLLVRVFAVAQSNAEELTTQLGGRPDAIYGGAVCDLAENSPALQGLTATTIPVHSVTGTGGPAGSGPPLGPLPDMPANFPFAIEQLISHYAPGPVFQAQLASYRFRDRNDFVVAEQSQRAGLGGTTVQDFPGFLHASVLPGVEDGVTEGTSIAEWIFFALAQTKTSGRFAAGLPTAPSNGTGAPLSVPGLFNDATTWSNLCAPGGLLREPLAVPAAPLFSPSNGAMVQIAAPVANTVFAPGDTVTVQVQADPSLNATQGSAGLGDFVGTFQTANAAPYDYSIQIPDEWAGSYTVRGDVFDSAGVLHRATPITIQVRPSTAPAALTVTPLVALDFPASGPVERLAPRAFEANGVERNVAEGAAGTTYVSADPNVVTVDGDGVLTAQGLGETIVTVTHLGLDAFSVVRVGPPTGAALPTTDVTSQLSFSRGGIRLDRATGLWVQEVRVSNPGPTPILGPLSITVSGLPAGVSWSNPDGVTIDAVPLGSPYSRLDSTNGVFLAPGEQASRFLHFLNPVRAPIDFTERVLQGTDP